MLWQLTGRIRSHRKIQHIQVGRKRDTGKMESNPERTIFIDNGKPGRERETKCERSRDGAGERNRTRRKEMKKR